MGQCVSNGGYGTGFRTSIFEEYRKIEQFFAGNISLPGSQSVVDQISRNGNNRIAVQMS